MRTLNRILVPAAISMAVIFGAGLSGTLAPESKPLEKVETLEADMALEPSDKCPAIATYDIITVAGLMDIFEEEPLMSKEDIELISLVTMAEAEGECESGQRLVIDTILNRVDSSEFPNTVYEVVYQPDQFTSVWNGRIDNCKMVDDICNLVFEELENRTNHDVCFFRTDHYSEYGFPLFQVGNHYFSGLE